MRFLVDECTVAAVAVNFRVVSVASSQLSIVFSGILPIDFKYTYGQLTTINGLDFR
jgi:hypothetical protein